MVDPQSAVPLRALTPAKKAAHDNFEAALSKGFGTAHLPDGTSSPVKFSPTQAALIARAVVDPAEARRQLSNLSEKRLPDGQVAQFIEVEVYTPIIATSVINPREGEKRQYPVAAAPDELVLPPIAIAPETNLSHPCLPLLAENPDQVISALSRSHALLIARDDEDPLRDGIKANGVLEPITLFPAQIAYRHFNSAATDILLSADGSTRAAFCHHNAGFNPVDAVYKWPGAPDREWRSALGNTISVQNASMHDVTEDQSVAYRSLTAPARILVGLRSEIPDQQPDVASAYRHIVAGIHVTPPCPWPEGGKIDEIADSVLDELLTAKKITRVEHDYLAGIMPSRDITAQGWSTSFDVRAAMIVKRIYSDANQSSVATGIKRITQKKQLNNNDRQMVATELIMRTFRHRMSDATNNAIRSSLHRTITLGLFRSNDWKVTARDPDQLLDDALMELREYEKRCAGDKEGNGIGTVSDSFGPARMELAMYGVYWLTSNQILKRDTPADNRGGSALLTGMLRSERGLRQLHRAVIEGRQNPNNKADIPLVLRDGTPDMSAVGRPSYLSDQELRTKIVPQDNEETEQNHGIDKSLSPEVQFTKGMERLLECVHSVDEAVKAINKITEDGVDESGEPLGEPLVSKLGFPEAQTMGMVNKLNEALSEIREWNMIFRVAQKHPAAFLRPVSTRSSASFAAFPESSLFSQNDGVSRND